MPAIISAIRSPYTKGQTFVADEDGGWWLVAGYHREFSNARHGLISRPPLLENCDIQRKSSQLEFYQACGFCD